MIKMRKVGNKQQRQQQQNVLRVVATIEDQIKWHPKIWMFLRIY